MSETSCDHSFPLLLIITKFPLIPAGHTRATEAIEKGHSMRLYGYSSAWSHMIRSLLSAEDVVPLAAPSQDLQCALGRVAAQCGASGMRISTSKSDADVLQRR